MTFLTKMRNVNLIFSRLIGVIILGSSLTLTSCMRHKTHDKKVLAGIEFGDNADFRLISGDGRIIRERADIQNISSWQIPKAQTFLFIVEIQDANSRSPLRDFEFEVLKENDEPICSKIVFKEGKQKLTQAKCSVRANSRSEIRWTEEIPYDFFKSESEPVLIKRKIKGLGARRGYKTVVFSVNPWAADRTGLTEVDHITFDLTESQAEILKDPSYEPQDKLQRRRKTVEDSTEIIIEQITSQVVNNTQPLLVGRSDEILDKINLKPEDEFEKNNLIFSKYDEKDFVSKRQEKSPGTDFSNLQKVYELTEKNTKVYVYKQIDNSESEIDGVAYDFTLNMKLGYKYPRVGAGFATESLTTGMFKIFAHLVLEPESGTRPVLLTPGVQPIIAEVKRNNELQINHNLVAAFRPSRGVIKLALRIEPYGIDGQFKPIDRLFTIGDFTRFTGKNGGLIEDQDSWNDAFGFKEYLEGSIHGEEAYRAGYVQKEQDFELDTLNIRFSTVEAGETAAQRTVIFKVETTVYDQTVNTRAGNNTPFEVVTLHVDHKNPEDKSKWHLYRITNAENVNDPSRVINGKIYWYDTITHKYYETEELIKRDVFISKWKPGLDLKAEVTKMLFENKKPRPDVKIRKMSMWLNPWDEKFGTFGTDARIASESFIDKVTKRKKIPSRFFIGDFGYETLRFRYEIDKDMNLNVKKTVLLNLKPLVLRYSSILEGINSIYNLRDGFYLLKVALQKDYLDPAARNEKDFITIPFALPEESYGLPTQEFDDSEYSELPALEIQAKNGPDQNKVLYDNQSVESKYDDRGNLISQHGIPYGDPRRKRAISFVKKLVRVNAGRIITPIEFNIEDLRLMRIRQQVFIQIEPINQVRLQVVNVIKKRFEKIFQMKTGEESPILTRLSSNERKRIEFLMKEALDAVALAVDDDIYISAGEEGIKDLQKITENERVVKAFEAFESSNFGLRLKDVLRDLKTAFVSDEKNTMVSDVISYDDSAVEKIERENEIQRGQRKEKDLLNLQIADEMDENAKSPVNPQENDAVLRLSKQCKDLKAVTHVNNGEGTLKDKESEDIDPVTQAFIPFETKSYSKNYSDIISKFKPFENKGEQFFKSLVNENTLAEILTNDFTLNPAFGPVSDLNILIDKKAGIPGRTFVGPMTFLYNTNKGSLRPTDNLDEAYCETDDCNSVNTSLDTQYAEIQNFEYEKSPYHGSIAHFQNVTFQDQEIKNQKTGEVTFIKGIETMFNEIQTDKEAKKYAAGQLTRFLDQYDTSYVSLADKPLKRLVCTGNIQPGSECYKTDVEKTVPLNDFLEAYSDIANLVVNLDYKLTNKVEIKFQKLTENPYHPNRAEKYKDYVGSKQNILPWGFISPVYEFGQERCDELAKESKDLKVCDPKNKDDGILSYVRDKYEVEASYNSPTKRELRDLIRHPYKGKEMVGAKASSFTKDDYSKMCDLLIYGEIGRRAKDRLKSSDTSANLRLRKVLFDLAYRCRTDVLNGLTPIAAERRFNIFETGRYYFLGGKSMNINASQDVKIGTSLRVSRAFGARPLRLITGIVEKGASFISKVGALVLGSFDFSYNLQRDKTFNEGTGISKGTYLVMQNAEFEIELTSYEQCLIVRWDPDYVEKYSSGIDFSEKGEFSQDLIGSLYLCSGETERTPIAVKEKYYYFTQHFTEGDMLDPADIHNHPWLLSLRGVREFRTFIRALQSHEQLDERGENKKENKFVGGEEIPSLMDFVGSDIKNVQRRANNDPLPTDHYKTTPREEWPIHQLVTTYNRVMPTFPGTYTQLNEEDYNDRDWPWAEGEPGQAMKSTQDCKEKYKP